MATKLTSAQKAVDSAIRAYNKQIEKAYKELGYNHTVTRNLVATANSIFGKGQIKEQSIKTVSHGMIDISTGEVHAIPQISRGKENLDRAVNQKLIQELDRRTKFKNTTGRDDLNKYNGTFNRLYSVSMAKQNAINKTNQFLRANIPQDIKDLLNKTKNIKDKNDIMDNYMRSSLTDDAIYRQIQYDDLASELFDQYHATTNEFIDAGIDDYEDNPYFRQMQLFAENYNNGTYTDEQLVYAMQARDYFVQSTGYTNDELNAIYGIQDDNDLLGGI